MGSCARVQAGHGEYADPGVRLLRLVTDLSGVFLPICAADFRPAMLQIAEAPRDKMDAP
jgi:hypothetical protein